MTEKTERQQLLWYAILPPLLAVFCWLKYTRLDGMMLVRACILLACGYCAMIWDWKKRVVPNVLLLVMIAAWVFWIAAMAVVDWESFLTSLVQSLSGGAALGIAGLLVYLLSKKGLGGGDVKFLAVVGLYMAIGPAFAATILGTTLSAITALILMAFRKISAKDAIPLIPFLYVGILMITFLS